MCSCAGGTTVHLELPNAPDVIWESTRKTQPVSIVPQGYTRILEEVPNAQIALPEKLRIHKPQRVKNLRGRLCPTASLTKSIWTIEVQIKWTTPARPAWMVPTAQAYHFIIPCPLPGYGGFSWAWNESLFEVSVS